MATTALRQLTHTGGPSTATPEPADESLRNEHEVIGKAPGRVRRMMVNVVVALSGLAMTIVAVSIFWLHIGIRPVLTASMRPTYGPGWALITKQIPLRDVKVGMIVVFVPPGESVPYAHRITSVTGPSDAPVITTKGDANPTGDPWHARLLGPTVAKVIGEVPLAGSLIVWLRQNLIPVIIIAFTGLCIAVGGARAILRPPSGMAGPQSEF